MSTRPIVIGLAGGVGAGKSTVGKALADLGCVVFDADAEAKRALDEPAVRGRLAEWWGRGVLGAGGRVDRAAVAKIVFGDADARRRLQSLTHPIVIERCDAALAAAAGAGARGFVIDAPLLYEAGLDNRCDAVVFVDAPLEDRVRRVGSSRGWSRDELLRRESAQMPVEAKRARASHVLTNDGDAAALAEAARGLFERIAAGAGHDLPADGPGRP